MLKPVYRRLDKRIIELWSSIPRKKGWEPAFDKWNDLLTPFNPRYPQPGFVGRNYFKSNSRIVVMGINPGLGKNFESSDERLFNSILSLERRPTKKNFKLVMNTYEENMPEWTIFSRWNILDRLSLTLDEIAYLNVLPVNTEVACDSTRLNPVYEYAISNFTSRQLKLLRPNAVLNLGKHGHKMLKRYWLAKPNELENLAIWHPTSRHASAHREQFSEQLDSARYFVERVRSKRRTSYKSTRLGKKRT